LFSELRIGVRLLSSTDQTGHRCPPVRGAHALGHLWRPQPTGAACTVLADVVHPRHHGAQHQSEESQKRTA
jgi:hypothetical protein